MSLAVDTNRKRNICSLCTVVKILHHKFVIVNICSMIIDGQVGRDTSKQVIHHCHQVATDESIGLTVVKFRVM